MIVLGLTGSIGMGKSTTAALFAEEGVPVWDADAAVHRIYAPGGAGVAAIGELVPEAVVDGAVDRARLRDAVTRDRALLAAVERAVHPLVAADRAAFVEVALASGAAVAVCDVPLLYEIGAEGEVDAVVVVTAPAEVQRERVLARPGMTEAALDAILARQIPDAEKRARADHVIDTGRGIDHARERVRKILAVERARAGMTDIGR